MKPKEKDWYKKLIKDKKKQKRKDPVTEAIYNPKEFRRDRKKRKGWEGEAQHRTKKEKVSFGEFLGKTIALIGVLWFIVKVAIDFKKSHP
ncbi:hypothetical protein [Methylomonas sp. DH-1]|uniref:hypothetical protein n=1 Tax=Methylomonas sp. (strain DH-1) TaxID=1727196 RepID=UPI0007C988ED|nr:hypothetical protein [Methylomonas sp. DH-1]ANE55657.1 hypothetical protein AYM39_11030 [Methylomonas sp. DH-1]ANE55667.1 hypothetical protein AYM39_11085 [Methylomonas sp. DH-1]